MKLEREWDALALEFQNPLLTHEWFASCAAAVSPPDELRIILIMDEEKLVAAAPMVMVRRWGVRRLEILGSSTLQEPSTFLFRDEDSLNELLRAVRTGVSVRVVKGQWSDPRGNGLDCRRNFRVLIDALAGRCPHVFVGTHDRHLAREALTILRASDTRCELEQMLGLPSIVKSAAEPLGIPVRVYVPFGTPYLPYNIRYVSHRPAMMAWALNGLLTGGDWNQGLL